MTKMHSSTKLQAVRNKYMSGKFMKVAAIVEGKRERVQELTSCE